MKIVLRLAVVVLVLLALVVGGLFYYIDAIAKTAIERGGTQALGVATKVSSTDVGIFAGTFRFAGLDVANPAGFGDEAFLRLGGGDVSVSFASLREDTVRLPTLHLDELALNLQRTKAGANYDVILANLKKLETSRTGAPPTGPGKKFIINEVVIRDISVAVDVLPIGGKLTHVNVPIDEIRLKDVGTDSDTGVLMAELTSIILKAVLASVLRFGGDLLPLDFLQDLGGELRQLENLGALGIDVLAGAGGQLQSVTDQLGAAADSMGKGVAEAAKQAGGALDEVGKAAEGALKGIGDLLGGKKDK